MKVTPIEKQSKKNQKEFYGRRRQSNGFNTGTRDMKSEKDYDRQKDKREFEKIFEKALDNYT